MMTEILKTVPDPIGIGIAAELFVNDAGTAGIRIYDTDTEVDGESATYSCILYKSLDKAEEEFKKITEEPWTK